MYLQPLGQFLAPSSHSINGCWVNNCKSPCHHPVPLSVYMYVVGRERTQTSSNPRQKYVGTSGDKFYDERVWATVRELTSVLGIGDSVLQKGTFESGSEG